jgi:hypothetical protein
MAIGVGPGLFAFIERSVVGQPFGSDQSFQGCKPVNVVLRAVVGLASFDCVGELRRESIGPLFPGEVPLF